MGLPRGQQRSRAKSLAKSLSCLRNGFLKAIPDTADPASVVMDYYQLVAALQTSGGVRWSSAYEDGGGLGQVVLAAKAVYDPYGKLQGVVGADVTLEILESFSWDAGAEVMSKLLTEGARCSNSSGTTCKRQQLRKDLDNAACLTGFSNEDCSVCTQEQFADPATFEDPDTCDGFDMQTRELCSGSGRTITRASALCDGQDLDLYSLKSENDDPLSYEAGVCCESCTLTVGGLVGIIVGIIAAGALCILAFKYKDQL